MRSQGSARMFHLTPIVAFIACVMLAVSVSPTSATTEPPASDSTTEMTVDDAIPQTPVPNEPTVPEAVTVVTRTPDGGLAVSEVNAGDPALVARQLDSQPNVVASTVKARRIFAAPRRDGSARDMQWPLNQLGAEDAWQASTGAGAVVAVLDTGVDAGHPDLAGRVLPGYDAIKRRAGGNTDPNGHGTHVAGSIAGAGAISGIAPDARILPVRVMNASGGGNTGDIVAGIVWAVNRGAHVINLSLGSNEADKAEAETVRWARERGVIVVAAAGNNGGSKPMFPAGYDDHKRNASAGRDPVIGVGAIHRTGERAAFSQRGNAVDVSAPGVRVLSTAPLSKGGYAWESGTSMAASFVSGTAALLVSRLAAANPGIGATERAAAVTSAIRRSSRDLGAGGTDKLYGSGRIDAANALAALGAPVNSGMSPDARLIGGARGRAVVSFTAPAGTVVNARLTTADGSGGAPAATNPSNGTAVWSGPGGRQVVLSLPGLSMTSSYTLTVFAARGASVSRTVTGLRPIELKIEAPKSLRGAKQRLRISPVVGPASGVPGADVSVDFRFNGKRKTVRTSPMTSLVRLVEIPASSGPVYFSVRADAGDGSWPFVTRELSIRRRG